MTVICDKKYHDISSFMCSAQEVTVLGVLHLIVPIVVYHGQGLAGSISYSRFEHQPQGNNFNYLVGVADVIGTFQRYVVPCRKLGVLMKSGGSPYPSNHSSLSSILRKYPASCLSLYDSVDTWFQCSGP
jgi:hypothetical protein